MKELRIVDNTKSFLDGIKRNAAIWAIKGEMVELRVVKVLTAAIPPGEKPSAFAKTGRNAT